MRAGPFFFTFFLPSIWYFLIDRLREISGAISAEIANGKSEHYHQFRSMDARAAVLSKCGHSAPQNRILPLKHAS